jgi:uncharacterized protein YndB with AHSA1/START domain
MDEGVVIRSVTLPATREEVWLALTTPEELSAWLGEVIDLEPRAGGAVSVREPDGATRRGVVEVVEPGRSFVLRWRRLAGAGRSLEVGDASRVVFELSDERDGTRLTVREEPVPLVASGGGR